MVSAATAGMEGTCISVATDLYNFDHHVSDESYESELTKTLHENKETTKEEKSPPFYLVKDCLEVLDVC